MKKKIRKLLPKAPHKPEDLRRNKQIKRVINVNFDMAKSLN